jgi:hypothetical protein
MFELFRQQEDQSSDEPQTPPESVTEFCRVIEFALLTLVNKYGKNNREAQFIGYNCVIKPEDLPIIEKKLRDISGKSGFAKDFEIDDLSHMGHILIILKDAEDKEIKNAYKVTIGKFGDFGILLHPKTKIFCVKIDDLMQIPAAVREAVAEAIRISLDKDAEQAEQYRT